MFTKRKLFLILLLLVSFVSQANCQCNNTSSSGEADDLRDTGYRDPQGICPFTIEVYPLKAPAGDPVYARITFENTTNSYAWVPSRKLHFDLSGGMLLFKDAATGETLSWCEQSYADFAGSSPIVMPWKKIRPGEKEIHYCVTSIPAGWAVRSRYRSRDLATSFKETPEISQKWETIVEDGAEGYLGLMLKTKYMAIESDVETLERPPDKSIKRPKIDYYKLKDKERTVFCSQKIKLQPRSRKTLDDISQLCNNAKFTAELDGEKLELYNHDTVRSLEKMMRRASDGTLKNQLQFMHLMIQLNKSYLDPFEHVPDYSIQAFEILLKKMPEIEREYYVHYHLVLLKEKVEKRYQAAKKIHERCSSLSKEFQDDVPENP